MLLSEALAQDEGVLRAYGDDERRAEHKAGGESDPNMSCSVLASGPSFHLNFLHWLSTAKSTSMLDYASLATVAAVVREGSFERAARSLNVTTSAVSQRIKQLEERLGSVLIIRGQPCRATDMGRLLCSHVEQVGLLEQELRGALPKLVQTDGRDDRVTLPPSP